MPQCAFISCKNNARKCNLTSGVSYFRFPSNLSRCAEWASIVARERAEDFFIPAKNSVICSDHFDELDIISENTNRRRLVKTAVPELQINNKGKTISSKPDQDLKRKKSYQSDDDSEESTESVPWSNECIDKINFDLDHEEACIKYEQMDYEKSDADPSAVSQGCDLGLEETVVEVIETEPEDPLHLNKGLNVTQKNMDEAITHEKKKCCEEGFTPGTGENLPQIDELTVMDFLATVPGYDKEQVRALWRITSQLIEDSIGYVQLRRDGKLCTVKCEVATKTTTNHCTIFYNEVCNAVQVAICDCEQTLCNHALTALIWLCRHKTGPVTYWQQPMISRDVSSMRLDSIFGLPRKSYQKNNTVLNDFIQACAEKEIFSPVLMKYHQDERPKASLHKLMSEFKHKFDHSSVELFLDFCRENLTKERVVMENGPLSPKVIQELEYGRITDALLLDVCQATDNCVEDLVAKIMYPQVKEIGKVKSGINHSVETTLKMKIKKCGLLLSNTFPFFSASPYGTTPTHVIYIKNLLDTGKQSEDGKNLSLKDTASMQLQMFLAKKKNACYCEVLSYSQIVISIISYNEKWLIELLKKATMFWKNHVFKCIMENTNKNIDITQFNKS